MKNIYIGTSGWSYKYWKSNFYPDKLPLSRFFEYYMTVFSTVELNNSFYKLPALQTIVKWRDMAPEGFLFAVKASRFITHIKRLKGVEGIAKFIEPIKEFKEKLGPILFQLPANFKFNPEVLENFLKYLPPGFDYTFEFRSPAWFQDETYEILNRYNIAFCIFDFNGLLSPVIVTADFAYIRLHGPEGKYNGDYSYNELLRWATIIRNYAGTGKKVYCYFDNDTAGFAPKNALELIKIIKTV
jgi:uncharacterized protein YecE (DUF72 family)